MKLTSSTHETRNEPQFIRAHNRGARKLGRAYPQARNRSRANRWPVDRLRRHTHNDKRRTEKRSLTRVQWILFALYCLFAGIASVLCAMDGVFWIPALFCGGGVSILVCLRTCTRRAGQ